MAIRASGDVLYEWDLASDRLAFFGDVSTLFTGGPLPVPATGEALHARINPEDVPRRRRALPDPFAGTSEYDCEFRLRTRGGEFQGLHCRGTVEFSQAGTAARRSGGIRLGTRPQHNKEERR